MPKTITRCRWAESDPLLREYHDEEWGVPVRDSRELWEMLMLEGFQAGLSWLTILRRREGFREAFKGFDPEIVAKFGARDVARLLKDEGIIRSRSKIEATINGARIYLSMAEAGEDFSSYSWSFVNETPIRGDGVTMHAQTPLSETISKSLKKKGFKFVGPVIVYAWMQAVGLVDDHALDCFKRTKRAKRA
jgi:DNA-3-methyladenine glycosylase I